MKTKISLLLSACFILAACSKLHYGHGNDDDGGNGDNIPFNEIIVDEAVGGEKEKATISPDQIIVSYGPEVDPGRRAEIRDSINAIYPIIDVDVCDCGDTNIEQWTFDPSIEEINIEGVVNGLPSKRPKGRARSERSLIIDLPEMPPFVPRGQPGEPFAIGPPGDSDVNIAVIDTGIDFWREDLSTSKENYLFPSGISDCYSTQSGWNFIGNPFNPASSGNQDITDQNGHGTYVTKIITDILDRNDPNPINYQILPLKVFDENGQGSYFDVLCAFAYVKNINEQGGERIDIVNASFGGAVPRAYFEPDSEGNLGPMPQMLQDLADLNVLVVTSAGNKGVNNEDGDDLDFISSFETKNLLRVGGYLDDGTRPATVPVLLHPKSNYGPNTIDLALAFNGYRFGFQTFTDVRDSVLLDGTSYSAAALSGLAAKIIAENGPLSTDEIKQFIFNAGNLSNELEPNKVIDDKVLLRD